jgi:hypothetical protein
MSTRKSNSKVLVFLVILSFIFLINNVIAISIPYTITPNGTTQNTSINILYNISASEGLNELTFNWNNTNNTLFNNDLLAWWAFNNNTWLENSTYIHDYSRKNNTITINNNASWGLDYGKIDGGYYFRGRNLSSSFNSSDYLQLNKWLVYNNTPAYSISLWVKPYNYDHPSGDASNIINVYGYNAIKYFTSNSNCAFNFNNVSNNDKTVSAICPKGNWSFLTATLTYNESTNTGEIKMYLNGELSQNKTTDGLMRYSQADKITIGSQEIFTGYNFLSYNGSIDDIMIWNKSLTNSEIYILYKSQLRKRDSQNWTYDIYNLSINNINLSSSQQTESYNYNLYAVNSTSTISSSQKTIIRIIKQSLANFNFATLIGTLDRYFYGANVHNSYLSNGRTIDTNNDGIRETSSNLTWHREMFLDAGLRYAREDMNLGGYYNGFCDSGFEYWFNTTALTNASNDGINLLPCVSDQGFAYSSALFSRSTDSHSGIYSMNITSKNLTSDGTFGTGSHHALFFGQTNKLYLDIGSTYNFSVWIKGNGTVRLGIQNTDTYAEGATSILLNDSWVLYSRTLNITYNSITGYRLVIDDINATDTLLIDDINFTKNGQDLHNTWWRIPSATINTTKIEEYQWARANGVKTLNIISYTPTFLKNLTTTWCDLNSSKGTDPCPPLNYDIFGQLVVDYINWTTNDGEYLDVVEYEVWNEPDISFWLSALATDNIAKSNEYIKLYNTSVTKVKEKYPNAIVFGAGLAGIYRYNMTNTYLSNFTDIQRNRTISYHRYAPSSAQSINIGNYLRNDTDDAKSRCDAYNSNCSLFIINEWNIYGGGFLENNSQKAMLDYIQGYIEVASKYPNSRLTTYQWSEGYLYNNTAYYPEYPSKWHMVLEPSMGGGDIRPQYNVTYKMSRYMPALGNIYNVTRDDNNISVSSSIIGSTKNIIITNKANEARNLSISISGVNRLIDVDSKVIYDTSSGSLDLGVLDAYDVRYYTEPILTQGDGVTIYRNYLGEYLYQIADGTGLGATCDTTTLMGYNLILVFSAVAIFVFVGYKVYEDGFENVDLTQILLLGVGVIVAVILFQASADNLAIGSCG